MCIRDRPYRRLEFESTMRLVERYFPKDGSVADIGCGPGRYSIEMLKRGYRVTLVDLSEESLEIARRKMAELGLMPGLSLITHLSGGQRLRMKTVQTFLRRLLAH